MYMQVTNPWHSYGTKGAFVVQNYTKENVELPNIQKEVSVSIEPFLKGDKAVLKKYIGDIVALAGKLPVSLHYDYFEKDEKVFRLVGQYRDKIQVFVHSTVIGTTTDGIMVDLDEKVDNIARDTKYAIVMTVKCGASGQSFNASALPKIAEIKKINPKIKVIVDGGVNESNVKSVWNAGADIVVVGSYAKKCWEMGDFEGGVKRLLQ